MLDASRAGSALAATCLLFVGGLTSPAGAAAPPAPAIFLSRDAVVKQSDQNMALMGPGTTLYIVAYPAAANTPRKEWYDGRVGHASRVLRESLMKTFSGSVMLVDSDTKVPAGTTHVIYLGDRETNYARHFPPKPEVDGHGFLIETDSARGPATRDIHIYSATGDGVGFGIYFFLMNYAGVRFLGPTPFGNKSIREDIGIEYDYNRKPTFEIPRDFYVLNPGPDYQLRIWTGIGTFNTSLWLCDTGGKSVDRESQRYEYHHNMYHIFDPAIYADKEKHPESYHPEYYPNVGGKNHMPKPGDRSSWQPAFSDPVSAQVTKAYADRIFTAEPDMRSISLTPNDGGGFADVDVAKGKTSAIGGYSIANIYRDYVNDVAKHVKEKWPGRYVAFLPYGYVQEPPDGKFEDNVMVFLFNEPKITYARWKDQAKTFGIYLWLYGTRYPFPNQWPHTMQEVLRWGHNNGFKAFKAEAYHGWAEGGPRMWVLCNLLWNADADVDALLKDYYEHAYGPAAPMISDFYAQAEKVYERRHKGDRYDFSPSDVPGIRAIQNVQPEDLTFMDARLTEAAAVLDKALALPVLKTDVRQVNRHEHMARARERLKYLRDGFDWGATYCRAKHAVEELATMKVDDAAAVAKVFANAKKFNEQVDLGPKLYNDVVVKEAPYAIEVTQDYKATDPHISWENYEPAMTTAFTNVTTFLKKTKSDRELAAYWEAIAKGNTDNAPFAEEQRLLLLSPGKAHRNLFPNDGFEDLTEQTLTPKPSTGQWSVYHNRMVDATVSLDTKVFHTGKQSIRVQGVTDYSGLSMNISIETHRLYRFSFWYRTENVVQNVLYQFGTNYPPRFKEGLPASPEWTKVERVFALDDDGSKTSAKRGVMFIISMRKGGSQDTKVWFDDIRLEMLAPEGVAP